MALLLRYVFAEKVSALSVEADVLHGIARLALRHPLATLVEQYGADKTRMAEDFGRELIVMGEDYGRDLIAGSRFRYGGFLADHVDARAGRADCCGRAGPLAHVCSMCSVVCCERCVSECAFPARAWRAGVTSPLCQCLLGADGRLRATSRGAECMLDDGSGRLRPVLYMWPP